MYYPRTTPAPLEFGVAFHAAMEKFYEPATWHMDISVRLGFAIVEFQQVCAEQLKKYKKMNGNPEQKVYDEYAERVKLGIGMLKYYASNVSALADAEFTPVAVEIPFEIAILSPEGKAIWCKCDHCVRRFRKHYKITDTAISIPRDVPIEHEYQRPKPYSQNDNIEYYFEYLWQGLPVTYGGRLDMLARDNQGRYWIFDWKTTSRILDEDAESSFLLLDDQISSYVWALRALNLYVHGFVYVEIKKAYPAPPEELTRLYKGRKYSTNKTALCTAEMYRKFVEEHDALAYYEGSYDDHLEYLKRDGPRFHQRHQVHKNDAEVDAVAYNIWLEAQDMTQNPRIYPQPGRFSCNTCLFKQPCIGKNMNEDFLYTLDSMFEKRTLHYWEEVDAKQASTE